MTNSPNPPNSIVEMPTKISPANKIQISLQNFAQGIEDAFQDIGALEVNTMIVTQITGVKFDPIEKYLGIRAIPRLTKLSGNENNSDGVDSILELKDEVLLQGLLGNSAFESLYNFSEIRNYYNSQSWYKEWLKRVDLTSPINQLTEGQSSFVRAIKRHMQLREKLEKAVIEEQKNLPNRLTTTNTVIQLPDDEQSIELLSSSGRFRRKLRKLSELRAIIESPEAANHDNLYDIIYAQTIVQIDGDIINRFDKRLFNDSNQEFLLEVHRSAVVSGEEDWRNLLHSIVDLATRLARFFDSKF
ncbi:MAG: hypothetical protein AB4041_17095 [Microcystaceae cyanobacterium]